MFERFQPRAVALLVLGSAQLLGCASPPATAKAGESKTAYSVNTPICVIAADPRGKMVLVQDVPGVMSSPKYPLFSDMSLAQMAVFAHGNLPKSKLDQVQADLDKLAAPAAP